MSWYSSIVSNTTSRISNLRSTLLGGDVDGDTEDDTNVCRVLRAYYTEKGRSFPQWLPPDPKAPPVPVATPVSNVGSRYGGGNLQSSASVGSSGGLSSLWDKPASPAPAAAVQNSLRPRASPFQNRGGAAPEANRYSDSSQHDYSGGSRPLPSQRLGSYQSSQSAPPAANTGQDKLRNLFGSSSSSGGGGGGGAASNGYPSRSNSPAYGGGPAGGGGGGNPYGGRGGGYAPPPNDYGGGGRQGVPRRPPGGGGLPSGPRMR